MTIDELKRIVENRISDLNQRRAAAYLRGDMEQAFALDDEIADTQETLGKL